MTRRHEPREEPFIGSLRDRIQQTKAENARMRANAPPRVEAPPSEDALRALRASKALARAEQHRHVSGPVWRIALLLGLVAFGLWMAWRYGFISARLGVSGP